MITLERGRAGPDPGMCFVTYLAARSEDGRGAAAAHWCPVLSQFLRAFNDILPQEARQRLLYHADASLRSLRNTSASSLRATRISSWLVTTHASSWANVFGQHALAQKLASLRFAAPPTTDGDVDAYLGALATARDRLYRATGAPPAAEAAVAARGLMERSGALAAAAGMAAVLEEYVSQPTVMGRTVRRGWYAWRIGWDLAQALSEPSLEPRGRLLTQYADAMHSQIWSLFSELVLQADVA